MKRFFVVCACLLFFLCATGCGNKARGVKTEYVEGVVKLDGAIVPEGTSVRFLPVTEGKGEPAGGFTDMNGVYRLSSVNGAPEKGAVEGEYKIVLSQVIPTANYDENDPKAPKDARGNVIIPTKELMPQSYTQKRSTPLTYTVVQGKQTHDIELSSKP